MSSGGGISRFASRKQPSSNGETSTSVAPSEYNPNADTKATKFSFGFNENSDTMSTASDDEFGFLGGGGNSIGGDDFFMMGGFDEVNSDYSATSTTEVSVEPQKCEIFSNSAAMRVSCPSVGSGQMFFCLKLRRSSR